MRTILLVILALLWVTPASAQNPTCPTRPVGDRSNACASTAFIAQGQSPVDIRAYGAIPNINNTATAVANQAAFTAAFAANAAVLCPAGMTFYTQPVTWSSTARYLKLDCDLIAGGLYSAQQAVININNATQGILIEGSGTISASFSAYPVGVNGINIFGASANVIVRDITIQEAFYGIRLPAIVSNIKILNTIIRYDGTGIQCETGCNYTTVDGNRFFSIRGRDGGSGAAFLSVSPNPQADHITIVNNQCDANGGTGSGDGGWCYTIQNGINGTIANNQVANNHIEGLTAYGTNITITGNTVASNGISRDIGISLGPITVGLIANNIINGAFSSGIFLGNNTNRFVTITGNTIIPTHPALVPAVCVAGVPNPNCVALPAMGTFYQEGFNCVFMDNQSNDNTIYGNTCLDPFGNDVYWNLLYLGTYQPNYYGPGHGVIGASGYAGWQVDSTAAHALANYSPVLSGCGTNPFMTGFDFGGIVTEGTGGGIAGCTLTFKNITSGNNWICTVTPQSVFANFAYSTTNTALTITHTAGADSRSFSFKCSQQGGL